MYESGFLYGALSRMLRLRLNVVVIGKCPPLLFAEQFNRHSGIFVIFWPNTQWIACLLVALSAARGPLFQRSSTVDDRGLYNSTGSMNISIAPYLLAGYFEKLTSDPQVEGSFTPELSAVVKNFSSGLPFPYASTGCGDYCMASVKVCSIMQ